MVVFSRNSAPVVSRICRVDCEIEHLCCVRSLELVNELSRTVRLIENAESISLGVFYWMPVFRGISDTTANTLNVSGSLFKFRSPTDPPGASMRRAKSGPKLSDSLINNVLRVNALLLGE